MTLRTFISVLVIFIVNLLVKLWFLTANDIAHDEPFTLFFAQGTPSEIISNLIPYNNPPLYEILMHYWIKTGGLDAFHVRLFSCLISCISAVVLFLIARIHWNERVGWQATIIFSFSTYQISFAHETRVYALFFLLTVLSFHFLVQLINQNKNRYVVYYVFATVLMLYAHFFSIWVIFIQLIYILITKKYFEKKILLSLSITLLMFIPYLKVVIERLLDSAGKGTWMEAPGMSALYENIRHFSNQPVVAVLFITFIFGSLIYLSYIKAEVKYLNLLFIWFFIPYFLLFFLSFKLPMFLGRYLIFITPAFILLIAVLADWFYSPAAKWRWLVFLPSVLMVASADYNPSNELEPRKAASLIRPFYEKQVMILLAPASNDIVISYHLDKDLFIYRKDYREYEKKRNYHAIDFISEAELQDEIIYLETEGGGYLDPERKNFRFLKESFNYCEELKINGENPKGFTVFYFKGLKSKAD